MQPDASDEYFRAIEEAFIRLRGAPLLLSPADWQTAKSWHEERIPLELVGRVMEEVFERLRERDPERKGQRVEIPMLDAYVAFMMPDIVAADMDRFEQLTGRRYRLYDYHGHPEATDVVVVMGSAAGTTEALTSSQSPPARGRTWNPIEVPAKPVAGCA